jgi:hypothetical protein
MTLPLETRFFCAAVAHFVVFFGVVDFLFVVFLTAFFVAVFALVAGFFVVFVCFFIFLSPYF